MKRTALWAFLLVLLLAPLARAESLDEFVGKIKAAHASLKDYEATFTQEVRGAGRTQTASGTLFIKLPDKMRWDYIEPTVKNLITDGNTSWMVLREERQVYVQPITANQNAETPLLMLTGKVDFKADYNVAKLADEDGMGVLELKPKKKGVGFKRVVVHVDADTHEIRRFRMEDLYGGVTTVTLSNIQKNKGIDAGMFTYKPEDGFEVLESPQMP